MSAKSRNVLAVISLAVCGWAASSLHAQQKDAKGCTDSPYLSRFPGAVIESCDSKDDDTASFVVGGKWKTIEGQLNHVLYDIPESASSAQVARNLTTALQRAGWTNTGGDSGGSWHKNDVWLSVAIGGGRFHITSIKEIKLTQDVVATAGELSKGIDSDGHAVVPGILFDTARADVKDESKPALDEVAKLLSQNPKLRLWVVGHTDSVGAAASNLDLSKRRAAAVIAVLVAKYRIAPARLDSFGVGPYSPVASNDTDAGRTQNRRVEIVKQ